MAAKNSGGQRSVRGTIPFATRRPAGGNPQKEQAQASQQAEEEPPIMVEGDEDEDEKIREEEERQAKIRVKRRKGEVKEGRSKKDDAPSKKRKYQTSIEEGVDLEGLVNKLLEGHNELLNLKEILASAPKLREMVKARLSRRRVASVRMGNLIPKEANWSVAGSKMDWKFVGTGFIDVMIKGKMCPGMVDTGAEMNIINGETAVKLGLEVDENDCGFLNGASGKTGYTGVASNMVIEIGRVKIRTCFYVMPSLDLPILLGRSFLCRFESLIMNKHDHTMFVILCDPASGNFEVITCRNTGPQSSKNRLNTGSYTFKESENRRRELEWDEGEEESDDEEAKGLVLSLTNISDAVELVSAYRMADPDAVRALAERIQDDPEGRRVDLAYRPVFRWVQDLQRLNAVTVRDARGLPNADQLPKACAGRSIVSLIDLYSGYDQFPVYPADRPITSMHTPRGLVHMNVAPQGWTNAVAMVQRSMIRVMQPINSQITEPYIDDLAVKGPIEKDESEVAPGVRRRDPWKKEAMAQRGAVAGPSGPTLRKGGQRRDQKVSRSMKVLLVYRAGDNLRVFLRDFEEYRFRREWGDKEKLANVTGTGVYKRKIEGTAAGCTRWKACKWRLEGKGYRRKGLRRKEEQREWEKGRRSRKEAGLQELRGLMERGPIGDRGGKEGEKGEKEGKLRRVKEVEAEVGKRIVEYGEPFPLRQEVEEGQVSKEENAEKNRKRKGWRDYMIKMLQYNDLPVNSTWDVRFERMLLSELVVSSSHSDNLQKMMELHNLLDEKCTRLFEDYAEFARKMGKMEGEGGVKEVGEDLDAVGKGL
ncbi:hypothetical protein CBR_g6628 [Chara braunii]|uniref:Reverse transcriptase domain-containing protein n=1 Tax=Chara braunii TaxID=69332 RepID=A0A388KKB4_CHABU|nr:hypothetical protein CBR_g6628 [Chara braunii]|eukprot:GBG70500.1 hypothetical protein CBR_g6628 [Chara braunii]